MIAKNLNEVLVYKKALAAADAVSALLKRPAFSKDLDLKNQLSRSSSRVAALIAEGFGQLTDRHVAVYYANARGSSLETHAHLTVACGRDYITKAELSNVGGMYEEIARMLTPWINYLRECDWKNRG